MVDAPQLVVWTAAITAPPGLCLPAPQMQGLLPRSESRRERRKLVSAPEVKQALKTHKHPLLNHDTPLKLHACLTKA